jgi:hypothetical protein
VKDASDSILAGLNRFADDSDISLQVGLVLYTRHDDPDWLWARSLSSNVPTIRRNIRDMSVDDLNAGGSGLEDMYAAMAFAMNETVAGTQMRPPMGWRDGAAKIMIPIGDEPPDEPDWEGRDLSYIAKVARELDPVHMYPLILPQPGPEFLYPSVAAMERIADATGGQVQRVKTAHELPEALVTTVKLAVRQHRAEVWREENPPLGLYAVAGALVTLVVFSLFAVFIAQLRVLPQTKAVEPPLDPRLTGNGPPQVHEPDPPPPPRRTIRRQRPPDVP